MIDEPLIQAVSQGQIETVKALLADGANVSQRSSSGWTPLIYAAFGGHAEMVRVLLEAGADVDARALDGWSVLMKAVLWGRLEVVRILLRAGADVAVQAADGWTARRIARERGDAELPGWWRALALTNERARGLAMCWGRGRRVRMSHGRDTRATLTEESKGIGHVPAPAMKGEDEPRARRPCHTNKGG